MTADRVRSSISPDGAVGAIPIDPIGDAERERIHTALIAGGLVASTESETYISVPPFAPPSFPVAAPMLGVDDAD